MGSDLANARFVYGLTVSSYVECPVSSSPVFSLKSVLFVLFLCLKAS